MRSTAKFVIAYDINDKYSLFGRHNSRCSLPVNLGRPPLIKTKHFQLLQSSLQPTVTSSSIALFFFVFYSGAIRTRASCVFFFLVFTFTDETKTNPRKSTRSLIFWLVEFHCQTNIIITITPSSSVWPQYSIFGDSADCVQGKKGETH